MSLFRILFTGSCVATDLRHPLKTLSNPSSKPPTIMLSFIFQNKTQPKGRKHNNQLVKSTRRCIMQQSTTNQRTINCGGEVQCRQLFSTSWDRDRDRGESPILNQRNNIYWMLSLLSQWDLMAHGTHKRMHGGLLRSWNMSGDRADFFGCIWTCCKMRIWHYHNQQIWVCATCARWNGLVWMQ